MKNIFVYRMVAILLGMSLMYPLAYSQQSIDSIASYFRKENYPSELIYLQTSKSIYETGEDLWFKAYQMDAQSFGLSDRSKTLYLQMISQADSVVWQEKYPIENGIASGHIYVDEKLPQGDYYIEGYTQGAFYKNDTTGIIPARKVTIIKNISYSAATENAKDSTFRFEMFPEGGNLVSGILSKLAFKATDGKGYPVSVEGTIYQDDKPLCAIKSVHNGMGSVLFIPFRDKKYRIELGNGKSYSLPDIHSSGMVLQLSRQDKKQLSFIVSKSGDLPDQQIYLVGQMRGMVCCIAKGVLKENLRISIPTDNFPYQGIAEFTLLDADMQPIAERLVYVHPEKKLYITAEPGKESFAIREKASLKIKVTDDAGKPVRANLGISVYDQGYSAPGDPMNIMSYSYLSSQIRGKIYDPAYYFDKKNSGRTEGLELLLLTQGWRRYLWKTQQPVYQGQPFLTDEIQGVQTIKSKKRNELNQGTEQLIQISGADGNSQLIWTDSIGNFILNTEMMTAFRGGYVYLKPMLSKEAKPVLELTDHFPLINSMRKNRQDYYPESDPSRYNQPDDLPVVSSDSTILLDEVTVMAKGHKPFRDKMMGRLDSLAQMNLNRAWVCDCPPKYLNDFREGYTHHPKGNYEGVKHLPVEGKQYRIIKYTEIVEDVQNIIYRGPIYSEEELLRMNNFWRTKGYYANREFYQPDEIDMQSAIPDARNTLLWMPSVVTDEKGEATLTFHCSDIYTNFICVVEGVDGIGLLGNVKSEFRVLRK